MINKTCIWNKSGSVLEKQCSSGLSSDDNDILELQEKTVESIPTQFVTKDNKKIQSVSPSIRLSVEVDEQKCNTDNGIQNSTNSSVQKAHGIETHRKKSDVVFGANLTVEVDEQKCNTDNGIQNSTNSSVQEAHGIETHRKTSEKLLSNHEVKEYYLRKRIFREQRKTNNYTTVTQCTITTETIMKAIEEQAKENTEANDKLLDIICRNLHGKFRNVTLSFYDEEVNKIMKVWSRWYIMFPSFRSTPLMYKCYTCHKGWWRLHPFKEHLKKVHSDPHLKLGSECISDEFSIIAPVTEDLNVKDVDMVSDCWKCGRDAAFHKLTYLKPSQYECSGCNKNMPTCNILKQHESTCSKYMRLRHSANKCVKCPVCLIFCMDEQALDAHMVDYHLVRSDEPIIVESNVCPLCSGRYVISTFHDCPAKPKQYKCGKCGRTFLSQTFLDIHMEYTRGSSVSQCVALNHYLKNSKNYCLMYMCSDCDTNVLLKNETIYKTHGMIHKHRLPSRLILLPTKCLSDNFVKSEKTFQIKDERLVSFLAGIVHLKDIETKPFGITRIYPSEQVQSSIQVLPTPNVATRPVDIDGDVINLDDEDVRNIDKDDDVINLDDDDDVRSIDKDDDVRSLDDDDDVIPSIESAPDPENFGDKVLDIKTMQEQLDEEIMRDLEMEATISKVFEASKGYQLLMEKESLNKASDTRQLILKESIKEEKESVNSELLSEESTKEDLMKIDEDGDKHEGDLIIPDEGVEDVNTNKTDIINEKDLEATDINKVISRNLTDTKQNSNCDTSTIVKEESFIHDDTIEVEPEVFIQQKVKLEPSEDLTKKLYEDMVQIIASNQSTKGDMDDVNMESGDQLHECKECNYRGEWSQYIEHVSTECPGTEFSCNLCYRSVRYLSLNHYLQHLTEHDYLPLSCPECQIQQESQDGLRTHVTSHIQVLFSGTKSIKLHDVTLYYCNKCGLGAQSKYFFKHWQTCSSEKDADSCEEDNSPECSSVSTRAKHVKEGVSMSLKHIKEAMKILQSETKKHKVTNCMVCPKKFVRLDQCKRHLIEHLLLQAQRIRKKNKNEKLKCFFCDKQFKMEKEFEFHTREHSHLPVYKCEVCSKYCSDLSIFNKHKKVHNLHAYECDLCDESYTKESHLIRHMKWHKKPTLIIPELLCKHCDKIFVSESLLKKHMLRHKKRYPCTVCDRKFTTWREKKHHMYRKHGKKATLDCPVCKKRFKQMLDMRVHMKTHSKLS